MSQLRSRRRLLAAVWGALLLLIVSGILAGMAGAQSEGQIGEGGEGAYPTAAIPPEIATRQEIPPTPWQSFEGISGEEGGQREETPTPAPPVFISTTEPASIINDRQQVLSVLGGNFSAGTVIRLVGWGFLPTTFVNTGAITATLPQGIPPGTYPIEVIDPVGGSATAPGLLIVSAPFISPTPTNTLTPMPTITPTFTPTGTPLPPTPMPGEPSLIVRNFIPVPTEVAPGGNVSLGFEVVNLGNRMAQGVSVSLDPGGKFVPAPGQSSATLPDIPPGGVVNVTLNAVVASDAPAGPNSVPLTLRSRDFMGQSYEDKATLSVNVVRAASASRLILSRYTVNPSPAAPGTLVDVELVVTNGGSITAEQVLAQITGDGALLPGAEGDTFSLGDIPPGESVSVTAPMIIRPQNGDDAAYGAQSQSVKLSWFERDQSRDITTSMTVEIAPPAVSNPLLLLERYNTTPDDGDTSAFALRPGQRFTLSIDLGNVGSGAASEMLVTFGTVSAPSEPPGGGGSGGSGSGGSGSGGSGSGGTTTNAFAPLSTGSTLYQALLSPGERATFSQEFIVNGAIASGIYTQPITVRYRTPAGEAKTETFSASLIVVAPPRVQTRLDMPLPETVNVGEPFPLAVKLQNVGSRTIEFTDAIVSAENADILEGAETLVGAIRTEKDATVSAVIAAQGEGTLRINVDLFYRDDLNNLQVMRLSYTVNAVQPPPPEEPPGSEGMPMPELPAEPVEDTSLGRLLLGLLGLGG